MKRQAVLQFGVALSILLPSVALQAGEAARTHAVTVDDYFTLAYLTEEALAPAGDAAVYGLARWQSASNSRKGDLWLVKTATGTVTKLTTERMTGRSPPWSPNGRHIYFAGNYKRPDANGPPYDGTTQIWLIGVEGGEPAALTRVPGGINLFDFTADGNTVYYTTVKQETDGEWAALHKQFGGLQYGHGPTVLTQLSKLELQTSRTTKVAELKRAVAELAVSSRGRRLALVTAPEDKVVSYEGHSDIQIVETASGAVQTLPDELWRAQAPSKYGRLNSLAWAADGKSLAFVIAFDGYPSEIIVAQWNGDQPAIARLARPEGVSLHAGVDGPLQMKWRGSSDLCFLGEDKARVRIYCAAGVKAGKVPEYHCLTPGDVAIDSFSLDASGEHAAVILGDPRHTPDLYLIDQQGKRRQLTHVNPQVETWKIPQISVVSWPGANGSSVEGILELPADAKPGQPLPLVVYVHGGPTSAWNYQLLFTYFGHVLLPARGYAVLSPNYRGSTGYGDQFLTDLIGRENDIEVEDILKGVDALIERKIADPERLGVTGWSNGGYLTNCLIAKTNRFKAASSGAGIADIALEWGTNDEPAYAMAFVKGFPWNQAEEYRRASPVFTFDKVRTPTIFHVGAQDERCPAGNSRMLYRALREYLKVPTQLIVYPDEPHGLGRYSDRKAKMTWDLAWFDRYILGKETAK